MDASGRFIVSEMRAIQDLRDCLHHSKQYRSNYQCLINCLRDKIIPKKYVKKIATRICLCKTSGEYLEKIMTEDADIDSKLKSVQINATLLASLESSPSNTQANNQAIDIIREMTNVVANNRSIARFLFLLHSALQGDFENMDPPKPVVESQPKEKKTRITKTIHIPLRSTYVPFLIGKKGVYLNALTKKLGCKLQLTRSKTLTYSETTECKITANSHGVLLLAEETIIKKAKETEEKRKLADVKTVEYYKRKASQRARRTLTAVSNYAGRLTGDSLKEDNRDTFSVKHQHQQFDTGKSQARPKPPPVLEEGSRCINCLTPYSSEKLKDTKCQFHPGFITEKEEKVLTYKFAKSSNNIEVESAGKQSVIMSEKMWSCCEQKMTDLSIESQATSHSQTGCCSGIHNWRPTKRASKKATTNKNNKGHGTSNSMPKLKKSAITTMHYSNEDEDDEVDDNVDVDEDDYKPPLPGVSLADYLQKTL